MKKSVLVADDDIELRNSVAMAIQDLGYDVVVASDGEEAITKVRTQTFDLALLDVQMPKHQGLEVLQEIKRYNPETIVIMLTAFSNVRDAVEATKSGAYNYLEKPVTSEDLADLIQRALKANQMVSNLRHSAPKFELPSGTHFVGETESMKNIFTMIDRLARVDTPVLIRGESGTGKELVAQSLHFYGPRKDHRFVSVNLAAIPETLIESELFGHEKGSFTGADARKIGKFQFADGGTLFLDEIGDVSAQMQVKLLRALQEKKFTPIGSNREIQVNVRVVAATNRDLEKMIADGSFREDLYYRLNVLPIQLPPLRQRTNDIEELCKYFIQKFNLRYGTSVTCLTPDAVSALKTHTWPGNIRELENVMEHAFVLETENTIQLKSLPKLFQREETIHNAPKPEAIQDGLKLDLEKLDFQASKEEFEKQFLISALKTYGGRINRTAIQANIPKKTLLRKLEKYGIVARNFASASDIKSVEDELIDL